MTHILVIHHALWMGSKLQHSLINPNQLRLNGVRVMDNPTQDGLCIYAKDKLVKLKMRGTVCYTNTKSGHIIFDIRMTLERKAGIRPRTQTTVLTPK